MSLVWELLATSYGLLLLLLFLSKLAYTLLEPTCFAVTACEALRTITFVSKWLCNDTRCTVLTWVFPAVVYI